MFHSDRFIYALIYAVTGIFLGIVIALCCSLYGLTTTSSKIITITTALGFVLGYVFPKLAPKFLKWAWQFFS